jgi:hypothetical protein
MKKITTMAKVTREYSIEDRTINFLDTEILYDIHPKATRVDMEILCKCINDAGMRADNIRIGSASANFICCDVRYRKPTKFTDDNGVKFIVGHYMRGMKVSELSDKMVRIALSKTWMRQTGNPAEPWHQHYAIDMNPIGSDWKYGYKRSIICDYPAGMTGMIYEYADSLEELTEAITTNLLVLKRYVDGGEPVGK